jgi:glycosyltransferase involved in cell wall biosynthesis
VQKPIRIVPLGINTGVFQYAPMDMGGPCVFGTAGRLESGGERKGIGEVIHLFQRAFPTEDDVKLRVKVFPDCKIDPVTDPRVEVLRDYLTEEELRRWFTKITCFVSAAKGEGWGLMQHQALAVGRPLISICYGGVTGFFTPQMGYPIEFRLVPSQGVYANCGFWAEPDQDHMVELMREVYFNREKAQQLGETGARAVSRFSRVAFAQSLVRVMQEFNMVT